MPARMIQERACSSPDLASLSDAAERLWWRLLTSTDSVGLFDAEPLVVAGKCVPLLRWPADKIQGLLVELQSAGLVALYRVDGVP